MINPLLNLFLLAGAVLIGVMQAACDDVPVEEPAVAGEAGVSGEEEDGDRPEPLVQEVETLDLPESPDPEGDLHELLDQVLPAELPEQNFGPQKPEPNPAAPKMPEQKPAGVLPDSGNAATPQPEPAADGSPLLKVSPAEGAPAPGRTGIMRIPVDRKDKAGMIRKLRRKVRRAKDEVRRDHLRERLGRLKSVRFGYDKKRRQAQIRIRPEVEPGIYRLKVRWAASPAGTSGAAIGLILPGYRQEVCMGELAEDKEWNHAGRYIVGRRSRISITGEPGSDTPLVDAVKLIRVEEPEKFLEKVTIPAWSCNRTLVKRRGVWQRTAGGSGRTLMTGKAGTDGEARLIFRPFFHRPGYYRLQLRRVESQPGSGPRLEVRHREGRTRLPALPEKRRKWIGLGIFGFDRGHSGKVIVRPGRKGGALAVDALRLIRVGKEKPAPEPVRKLQLSWNDADRVTVSGNWIVKEKRRRSWVESPPPGAGEETSLILVEPKLQGNYRIFVKWRPGEVNASNTAFRISHHESGTSFPVEVNQRLDPDGWYLLGSFTLAEDDSLILTNENSDGYVGFEAVRFLRDAP